MAMYSYNGHILPEIPVVDGHPYAYLFYLKPEYVQSYYGKTSMHFIHLSSEPYVPNSNGYFRNYTVGSSVTAYHSADGEDWVFDETYTIKTDGYFGKPAGEETVYCWCNTNLVNNDGSVYLAASEPVSTAFVLPDGTELPALPEGCFEQRPYGFITAGYQNGQLIGCALHTGFDIADYTENVLAGQQINALVCHAPNFMSYEYEVGVDTTWKAGIEDTSGDGMMAVVGTNGNMSIGVAWSNFDIFYLDNVDDEGNRVLSDTLYHKSDVNYRVYGGWLNSMGNQARRLGNVSGALKPGEMESVFQGVTAGGGSAPLFVGQASGTVLTGYDSALAQSVFTLKISARATGQ